MQGHASLLEHRQWRHFLLMLQDTADACCQACRSEAKCNVWVWCGDPAGCAAGRSHKECWLKTQAALNVDKPAGGRGNGARLL